MACPNRIFAIRINVGHGVVVPRLFAKAGMRTLRNRANLLEAQTAQLGARPMQPAVA